LFQIGCKHDAKKIGLNKEISPNFTNNANQGLKMVESLIFITKQRRGPMIASDLNFPNIAFKDAIVDCISKHCIVSGKNQVSTLDSHE